jgi:ankyrin repeat protein
MRNPDLTTEPNKALAAELRVAIDAKDLDACRDLLDAGADPNAPFGIVGSLLTYAIEGSFTEGALLLLDRGAHAHTPEGSRHLPIFSAARMGNARICGELLDRGVDIESQNHDPFKHRRSDTATRGGKEVTGRMRHLPYRARCQRQRM